MSEDGYQPWGSLSGSAGAARDRGVGRVAIDLARGSAGALAGLPWTVRGAARSV